MKRSIAFLMVTTWSTLASASKSFPAAVDQHLKLIGSAVIEKAIAPPDGCLLCHAIESGGTGTNNAFGAELRHYGLVGGLPSTVATALDAVKASDPRAIQDLLKGIDPNHDTMTVQAEPPQPQYGCSVGTPEARRGEAWSWSLLTLSVLAWASRTARRRPSRGR